MFKLIFIGRNAGDRSFRHRTAAIKKQKAGSYPTFLSLPRHQCQYIRGQKWK